MNRRSTGFPPEVRQVIVARAAGCCERCGQYAMDAEVHHRRPRGMGGTRRADTNAVSAALFLCSSCHRIVEAHRRESLEAGWLVAQSASPAEVPVLYRWRYVLLADDGSIAPVEGVA